MEAKMLPRGDTIDVVFPDEDDDTLTAAEKAVNAAIEELSSSAEKGAFVSVYRQPGNGREPLEFVFTHPADLYSIDQIIDSLKLDYGGGKYRIFIKDEKGKIRANKLICIAEKISDPNEADNVGLYGLLNSYMSKQDRMMQHFLKQNHSGHSRTEFFQEMILMKNLFNQNGNNNSNTFGQIKELVEAMTLIKDITPEAASNSGLVGIMRETVPLLTSIANASLNAPGAQPGAQPEVKPGAQPGAQFGVTQPMINIEYGLLKKAIEFKNQGQTPEGVAEFIYEEIAPKFARKIEAIIILEKPLDKMAEFLPDVLAHHDWFLELIEWLRAYYGHSSMYEDRFNDPTDLTNSEPATIIPSHGSSGESLNDDPERQSRNARDSKIDAGIDPKV